MLVGMMSLLSGGFVQAATLEKTEPSIETITVLLLGVTMERYG